MSAFAAPIAEQIWDMKYRLKAPDGTPIDDTIEATWRRIARALAAPEDDAEKWEAEFYNALEGFRYLPAGRIVAGAGAERDVTLFNCFVMGTVADTMAGIFDGLKEAALTMQQGGGIGYDFSTLRPKGAAVKGVGADASGPLSFMDVWDSMCRTIMSAGSRRGAMMATMRCDHPDIEAFIEAKRDPARLRMFNLSVLVTDPFMEAVKSDTSWDLVFGGTVYKTLRARALWDRMMQSTYDVAEPGVIFIDRINRLNPLNYVETVAATNPCVTADTWVMTGTGARQVSDLIGTAFDALIDGAAYSTTAEGFFSSGVKPVLTVGTTCGREMRLTANHRVLVRTGADRTEWKEAGTLVPGDNIVLHRHEDAGWAGTGSDGDGYLLGLLVGDGTLKADKAVLSIWRTDPDADWSPEHDPVMRMAEAAARAMPHRTDFAGWMPVEGRGEWRMATGGLKALARRYGLAPGAKKPTAEIERASSEFCEGFLRGLFDADGSVQGTQAKGVSVRLAQSDLGTLRTAQRMLARLGVNSTLYQERRAAGPRVMPDGRGGSAEYLTAAQHELVIARENLAVFQNRIGFADPAKAGRLANLLNHYKRPLYRDAFVGTVDTVTPAGEEEVFDVSVPGINAFDANGFMVHNCGEQPLPPYGACLLGSINLATLVTAPFADQADLDKDALSKLVATAVRMMDNVIDVSNFPLEAQRAEAQAKRRIGLGVTGLADALLMVGLRYGSDEAAAQTAEWLHLIQRAAYLTSTELAAEKGSFPLFDKDAYLATETIAGLDDDVKAAIARHGIRNALLTSIAPTGTISLLAGNVSSGVEPVFAYSYTRKVLQPDGSRTEEEVVDYAVTLWRQLNGDAPLPDHFVNAQTLAPEDHVRMQAACQPYIDSSISKTINCPADISFDDFKNVYALAYETGCKGCTTYRPNDVTGSVLSVEEKVEVVAEDEVTETGADVIYMSKPLDRPESLDGATYKLKWPESEHAIYITLNDVIVAGRRRPFEVFINSKNMEHFAWTVALTRMISAVFRRGGDVSFVVEELKAVFDPRGGAWMGGRYVPSILAAIGGVIERHLIAIGFIEGEGLGLKSDPKAEAIAIGDSPRGPACPSCGQFEMRMVEGCMTCGSCGYSKCS